MLNLPHFSTLNIEAFSELLTARLNQNRAIINKLLANEHSSWQTLMDPLDELDDQLNQLFSPISHIHSVLNSEKLRECYKLCLAELTQYSTEIGQNTALYQAIKSLKGDNSVEEKIIADDTRDFELAGVGLAEAQKTEYKKIQARLSELSTQYENNLLDATQAFKKTISDKSLLKGLPQHAINTASVLSCKKDTWTFTLDYPAFHAIVTYADNESLREEFYRAFVTRASDCGPNANQFDNSEVITETLCLRQQKASLLDFKNYSELSLTKKMAPSTETVLDFLQQLAKKSFAQGQREFASLEAFAGKKLNPWDVAYYSEKQRQALFDITAETLRPYFPETKCLQGMFAIAEKLYGITFKLKENVDTWHPEVSFYELYDVDNKLCGGLYLDLYARENKRGGAWMDDCVCRRKLSNGKTQHPVAYLTCNFAPALKGEEAYLSHSEVETLFHEFGHCLHHLLTKIDYLSASGINGVEWDAVELPSQFFENYCWQREPLNLISAHRDSGKPISDALFEKMVKARNFQSAMTMLRQLEFALFDFSIHLNDNATKPIDALEALKEIRNQIAVTPSIKDARFPHGFSHIFAGGYAAGYYSYKWAEVLSSDVFSAFEEEGVFSPTCGKRFLDEILARGSSRTAKESFIAFRGREPNVDALLRHSGIGN